MADGEDARGVERETGEKAGLWLQPPVENMKASFCDIDFLRPLFRSEGPQVVISYQWAAKVGDVYDGLHQQFGSTMDIFVWLDIFFNWQGADLKTDDVLKITEEVHLGADIHVLIVHREEKIKTLLHRAWILLELGVRAASDLEVWNAVLSSEIKVFNC